jgi:hypothetical protein
MRKSLLTTLLVITFVAASLPLPQISTATTSNPPLPNCKINPCLMATADLARLYNARLSLQVGAKGQFNIGAFPDPATGNATSDSWDLMYRWPNEPNTSFTTLRIDRLDAIYGDAGTRIEAPTNIDSQTNRSRWQIGDIEVTQILQLVTNNQTGQEDAVKIAYTVRNIGAVPHDVGNRVMIDTELNYNDGALFRVPNVGLISAEREFTGVAIPRNFATFFNISDNTHVAAATLRGAGATPPDRLVMARWPSISGTYYDYTIDPNASFANDSAYAVYWNPTALAPGDARTYVTFMDWRS